MVLSPSNVREYVRVNDRIGVTTNGVTRYHRVLRFNRLTVSIDTTIPQNGPRQNVGRPGKRKFAQVSFRNISRLADGTWLA